MSYLDAPHCYLLYVEKWVGHRRVGSSIIGVYSSPRLAREAEAAYIGNEDWEAKYPGYRTSIVLHPIDLYYITKGEANGDE